MMLNEAIAAATANDHSVLRGLSDAESHLPAAGLLSDAASAAQDIARGLVPNARKRHALARVAAGDIPTAPAPAPAPVATPEPTPVRRDSRRAYHCADCYNGVADHPGGLCIDCESER